MEFFYFTPKKRSIDKVNVKRQQKLKQKFGRLENEE